MTTEAIRRSTLWLRCLIRHGATWVVFCDWELPVSCVPKSKSDTGWYACPQAKELLPCSRLHSLLPICSRPIVTTVFLQHQCCLLSFALLCLHRLSGEKLQLNSCFLLREHPENIRKLSKLLVLTIHLKQKFPIRTPTPPWPTSELSLSNMER